MKTLSSILFFINLFCALLMIGLSEYGTALISLAAAAFCAYNISLQDEET